MTTPATPPSPTRVPLRRALLAALYTAVYRLGAGRHDGGLTILTYHSLDDHPTGSRCRRGSSRHRWRRSRPRAAQR